MTKKLKISEIAGFGISDVSDEKKYKARSIYFEEDLWKWVNVHAAHCTIDTGEKVSASEVIIKAVKEYKKRNNK